MADGLRVEIALIWCTGDNERVLASEDLHVPDAAEQEVRRALEDYPTHLVRALYFVVARLRPAPKDGEAD